MTIQEEMNEDIKHYKGLTREDMIALIITSIRVQKAL